MSDSEQAGEIRSTIELGEEEKKVPLEQRLNGRGSPVSRVNYHPRAQDTFDLLFYMLQEPEFGETPQERLEAVKDAIAWKESDTEKLFKRDDIGFLANETDRLEIMGENYLYGFIEQVLLQPMRNHEIGALVQGREPKMTYEVFSACPQDETPIHAERTLNRQELEGYRSMDFSLALFLSHCESCDTAHDPSLSRMIYRFQHEHGTTIEKYHELKARVQKVADEVAETFERRRMPDNPHHSKRSSGELEWVEYTKKEREEWNARHGREYEKQRKKLRRAVDALDRFTDSIDILAMYARVKGSDRWWNKVTDNLWNLDALVPDESYIGDSEFPTTVKDYLGIKLVVTGERAMQKVVNYLHRICELYGESMFFEPDTIKDRWHRPVYEIDEAGQRRQVSGWRERDGKMTYRGWKGVVNYCGMDIEVQIMTPEMLAVEEGSHNLHETKAVNRRIKAEEEHKIPHTPTVELLKKITSQPI